MSGFTPDGYCSEGVGYWNYGFGHYLMLAETIKQATGGKVDWMAQERIEPIALFARRMEILPGIYPAFADCDVNPQPDRAHHGLSQPPVRLGAGRYAQQAADAHFERDVEAAACSRSDCSPFPIRYVQVGSTKKTAPAWTLARLVFRRGRVDLPAEIGANLHALGAALKGGHNAEQHNHNDVGSFVVALGKSTPLVDPGPEIYTARTFSPHRYESNVLNSFGHSVPRVAGQLQATGAKARAKILKTEFTDAADTLVMDISSAYPVESLEKLERTFVFSREGAGKLTVTDEVEFSRPENFGTALITLRKVETTRPEPAANWRRARMPCRWKSPWKGANFGSIRKRSRKTRPSIRVPIRLGWI